jgi:hypothetical protein
MPKASLVWKAANVLDTAFSAQVENVTYHVAHGAYGHPAYLEVHGPRGGLKRLDIGLYLKGVRTCGENERPDRTGADRACSGGISLRRAAISLYRRRPIPEPKQLRPNPNEI